MTKNHLVTFILALLVVGVGIVVGVQLFKERPQEIACTLEAKLCPDGSAVGRTGPRCEFAPCPAEGLKTFRDEKTGITFQYPERLPTTYITAFDWPPKVAILNEPFACTEAGSPEARAGRTEERLVDDRIYCVTTIVEGAAGSVYTQYAYAFSYDDSTLIFTFSTRGVQCGNYDETERLVCEREREVFDLDFIIDRIAKSLGEKD